MKLVFFFILNNEYIKIERINKNQVNESKVVNILKFDFAVSSNDNIDTKFSTNKTGVNFACSNLDGFNTQQLAMTSEFFETI